MVCDRDGTSLFQRDDDRPEVIANRLAVFRRQTFPLIKYYEERGLVRTVQGAGSKDEVLEKIVAEIGSAAGSPS
jgi:adenylate kinase